MTGGIGETDFGGIADVFLKQPDELSFVDEDIQELFKGCSYIMGMPLMAQLIKELRLWRETKAAAEVMMHGNQLP